MPRPSKLSPAGLSQLAERYRAHGVAWTVVAETLGIPRQRLYRRAKRAERAPRPARPRTGKSAALSDEALVQQMRLLLDNQPYYQGYGYRRMQAVLGQQLGLQVNHKRLRRVMREAGLCQPAVRIARPKGDRPRPGRATRPNEVWQMDMTKVYDPSFGWVHVIAIIDTFDRQVVGHHVSLRARACEWAAAWDQALLSRFPQGARGPWPLTLQVDNGCQPTSRHFRGHIATADAGLAYTALATPEHNAIIERFFRSLKEELLWPNTWSTMNKMIQAVDDYIRFYNEERVHSALGYLTPADYHRRWSTPSAA